MMNLMFDEKKFKKDRDEFINSDAGKKYLDNIRKKHEIKIGRYKRFEKYLETHDFDKLIYRLILEHGDEWREKCWHSGYEVHPNNKLEFLIDFIVKNYEPIRVQQIESNEFPSQVWFFRGYYFRIMYGQGSVISIYNGEDFKHLLSV